ncbi:hypothetical protein IMG5_123410 [Ichthyophthirius multifiliis]|uniref:Uncharacterized protein n=1 Tax=Ichthyophthirius multifiliis TaxID=5932 RepID=G0QVG2_ICHMU|nr:hypothetical protein IMG5_123410 [Ichthyophthirius multifiliis]EGR30798.1 hypothetical protein IMG5_123410 [Ichthyophthirius multifiliis]|eukprot:XP_004032385.1 hypothetical protein IMG5_123410 [Ichthyophthirius multifiliis]
MNPLGPLDIIDPSNIGGREQLMNRMFNHQTALLTIKPTIDIRKGPRPHVDAKKLHKDKPKYKKLLEYGNVFNTFNAVQNTKKGLIDSKEPQTLNLTYLWGNKPHPFIHNQKAQIITKEEYDIYKKEFLKKNHGSYLFDDDFGDEIPKVKGNLQEDYDIIKQKLVFLIVKYRIYKEEDIEVLFARTTVHNRHLKMEKLDEIFILIKDELNK